MSSPADKYDKAVSDGARLQLELLKFLRQRCDFENKLTEGSTAFTALVGAAKLLYDQQIALAKSRNKDTMPIRLGLGVSLLNFTRDIFDDTRASLMWRYGRK